jgi:hypothetical protein
MGQAKLKGLTFEDRKKFAIERDQKAKEERQREFNEYWDSLSQEEKDEIIKAEREKAIADAKFKRLLSGYLGFALSSNWKYRNLFR